MMKYRTIVISDLHLGSTYSRAKDVTNFLSKNKCDTLILNGDIIDGWALKRGGTWNDDHMKCIRKIIKKSNTTNVYWIRGNHDDFLHEFIPFDFGKILLREDLEYMGMNGKKYLILHGDIFDIFINKMKWLAKIGSVGYDFTLWMNKWYNKYRAFRGLEYFSLSQKIKASVKEATNFIGDFENHMVVHAKSLDCDGVICGHIHKAEIKLIDNLEYMNSGDWVESNSALVEDEDGNWSLIYYS
jgi:UDP-2,3-diacylglucosamine pyrophosphatase LpxH